MPEATYSIVEGALTRTLCPGFPGPLALAVDLLGGPFGASCPVYLAPDTVTRLPLTWAALSEPLSGLIFPGPWRQLRGGHFTVFFFLLNLLSDTFLK